MKKLRIAYFGTPYFAARFLEKLVADQEIPVEVSLVVTQPDRKVGRRQLITPTPVKIIALKHHIPVVNEVKNELDAIDLALVYAYGEILPETLLDKPKYGFWNVHPSLLPAYRGASPIATPLIEGRNETGVTLIKMDEQMDHGPIIAQQKAAIEPQDKRPDLEHRLTELGYEIFKKEIKKLEDEKLNPTLQDHPRATYTKRLTKEDGFVELSNFKSLTSNDPQKLFNRFKGLYPWPGIWSKIRIKNQELRIKITDIQLVDGKLIIKKVQLEGKNEVDWETFKRAYSSVLSGGSLS